jgi:uncharacterized protein (TIGR02246 family)
VPIVRRAMVMLTCAASLSALISARVAAQSASPAAGQTPTAALQAWVDAFNSRDPKRIVARYAPTAVFWGTTAKTIATTPAQVWDYFKDAGQRPATRVTIDSTHQRIFGDTAVISGAYTFADVKEGEQSNVRPARYTIVFRRTGDGWLIVDHHSSRVPQP